MAYEPPSEPSFAWPTGVDVGEPIPAFRLPDADGVEVALADLTERSILLVNWSPRCGFCTRIAPELAELQPQLRARGVEMVFITLGDVEENKPLLEEHGLEPRVLFGDGLEVEVFAGVGTPSAYLVDVEGKAASALTIGADTVPDLAGPPPAGKRATGPASGSRERGAPTQKCASPWALEDLRRPTTPKIRPMSGSLVGVPAQASGEGSRGRVDVTEEERQQSSVSRRTMLKRIGAAGAIAWVTPVISSLSTPAFAASQGNSTCSSPCTDCFALREQFRLWKRRMGSIVSAQRRSRAIASAGRIHAACAATSNCRSSADCQLVGWACVNVALPRLSRCRSRYAVLATVRTPHRWAVQGNAVRGTLHASGRTS